MNCVGEYNTYLYITARTYLTLAVLCTGKMASPFCKRSRSHMRLSMEIRQKRHHIRERHTKKKSEKTAALTHKRIHL